MSLVKPRVTLFVNARDGDRAGQHVRQRQEHQHPLALVQQRREARLGAADLVQQVGMGELAALGPAGGSRGVDQRRGIGGLDAGQPVVELLRRRPIARPRRARRERPCPSRRCAAPCAGRAARRRAARCCRRARRSRRRPAPRRSRQHEPHLFGRAGLIDRHGDRADRQDREVQDRPLVAGRRKDRDPVAGLNALGDQTQCRRTDLIGDLRAGDIRPSAVDQPLEDHMVGIVAFVGEHELTTLSCSPTVNEAGTLNSRTIKASRSSRLLTRHQRSRPPVGRDGRGMCEACRP